MKLGLTAIALAALLNLSPMLRPAAVAQQQPAVPDAPSPQAPPPLSGVDGPITPGKGSGDEQPGSSTSSTAPAPRQPAPSSHAPSIPGRDEIQTVPPEMPLTGEGVSAVARFVVNVNFVEVPVTVKDSKGKLVAGLTFRDFKVYENDTREPLRLFTVDPFPLSIAFVIDQSLTSDVMAKVNNSLGAIQGALTPYDEVAVFSYNNGAQERTGFTGAQSSRLPAVLALTKETGSEMLVPVNSGPLAGCNIRENGNCVDPNLQPGKSAGGNGNWMSLPKDIHTLNDAILAAAKELSSRPKGRRRIIYVISDGKEYGSKAKFRDVVKYLQTNNIEVDGTLVGDSSLPIIGFLDRLYLPLTMRDNLLPAYASATGGNFDAEFLTDSIEKSFAKIAAEVRNRYTLDFISHLPLYDGKYRTLEVKVIGHGNDLTILTKRGYYPTPQSTRPWPAATQ